MSAGWERRLFRQRRARLPGHAQGIELPMAARLSSIRPKYNKFVPNGVFARLDGSKIDVNGTARILFRIKELRSGAKRRGPGTPRFGAREFGVSGPGARSAGILPAVARASRPALMAEARRLSDSGRDGRATSLNRPHRYRTTEPPNFELKEPEPESRSSTSPAVSGSTTQPRARRFCSKSPACSIPEAPSSHSVARQRLHCRIRC